MNFFEFEENLYGAGGNPAMDEDIGESTTKMARATKPNAPHGEAASAKGIAVFSDKDRILSAEELIEHRKHCRAKPGNCPFEKAVDEADDFTPNEIKVTKQDVFNRLANVLTQMFQVAKNLAKPAIADPEGIEEKSDESSDKIASPVLPAEKKSEDEAPAVEPNADAKTVAEIIEGGIEKMVELAKSKGCLVDMDEKKTKYIVHGPAKG